MKISITVPAEQDFEDGDIIDAICMGKDDWYISENGMVFDRYFLSDVFDLIRDYCAPVAA